MSQSNSKVVLNLRKPYEKPQVQSIRLSPEEAVLGGCKLGSQLGPSTTCSVGPAQCNQLIS